MRWLAVLFVVLASASAAAKTSNPAFLGVQMNDAGGPGGPGPCIVSGVTKDSGAEAAGLRDSDIFITIDGKAVPDCNSLIVQIQAKSPGDVVKLVVTRGHQQMTINATLMSRDEVLRKRFGGLPVPVTKLTRVDDKRQIDISTARRQTTIIGWFPRTCTGCDQIFTQVAKWTREERQGMPMPIKVAAATAGDPRRTVTDNLELLKTQGKTFDVPLLVADAETYEHFAIGDGDRIQFMVIDCQGIVQHVAPIVPSSEDAEAVLDELYAAAEQASRRMK